MAASSFFGTRTRRERDDFSEAHVAVLASERSRICGEDPLEHLSGKIEGGISLGRLRAILVENKNKRKKVWSDAREEEIKRVAMEVQERVLVRRYPNTIEKLQRIRSCIQCKECYRRCEALGNWQCFRHKGRPLGTKWTCCGRSTNRKSGVDGCTRCDHSDRYHQRNGVLAYLVDDAELSALISPDPRAVRMSYEASDLQRWSGGPVQRLASKLDGEPRKNVAITDGMREQDALAVPRAQPRPHALHVETAYKLASVEDDPVSRRGETLSESEAALERTAAKLLAHKSVLARPLAPPKRVYYVLTEDLYPDQALIDKLGA